VLPLLLMRLSSPVALTAEVSFIFVAEAALVVLAAEVSFPPGPSRSDCWPLELCYGLLKYCRWHLGNQDGCPSVGDRWLWEANHRARAYIKEGWGGGPPTLRSFHAHAHAHAHAALRIVHIAWPVAFALLCFLRPAPFSLPSPLTFFGGGFSLSFLGSLLGCLLRSLPPSPWC
jgi:hypothetical protein